MPFRNSLAAGTVLVRPALQSPNYVPGVSGWTINVDGTAEFLDLTLRGSFATGVAPNARVEILPHVQSAQIDLYTGVTGETVPAKLRTFGVGGGIASIALRSAERAFGFNELEIDTPDVGSPGFFAFNGVQIGSDFTQMFLTATVLRVDDTGDVSPSSTAHPLQLGLDGGPNLRMDTNEIMAVNAGSSVTLFLQADGGSVAVPDMRSVRINDATARTTTSLTYAVPTGSTANITVPTPASKVLDVAVFGEVFNSAANDTWLGYEIREDNAAGAVVQSGNDGLAGKNVGTAAVVTGRAVCSGVLATTAANLFVRVLLKVSAGTGTCRNTSLSVRPSL